MEKCIVNGIESKDSVYRDVNYWNQYYDNHPVPIGNGESQFARDMMPYMESKKNLIELGCGNGRDSLFFASKGIHVTGIDISKNAINMLNKVNTYEGTRFLCEDFSGESDIFCVQYDYCYSRFTLHAINEIQEQNTLRNAWNALKKEGLFFIEARSINDDIYGKGKCIGKHSYIYNDHFRRFIDKEELVEKLINLGFKIIYEEENTGFALYKDQNPRLVRVVAKKI